MDTNLFEKVGFTKGETKVYFALLDLDVTTTGPLILESGVARSKVYEILEKLKEKGLISEFIKRNTRHFQAASPERVLDYIKTREKELEKKEEEFKKILPELIQRQKCIIEKQEVKVYVGFEGVKTLFDEILDELDKGDEYLAMTFSDKSLDNKSVTLMFRKFHQKRSSKGIKSKILCSDKDVQAKNKMNYSDTGLYEFRITKQLLPTGIAVFKDTVSTFNWGKTPKVFSIICKDNAEQYKKFFYNIWKRSKII